MEMAPESIRYPRRYPGSGISKYRTDKEASFAQGFFGLELLFRGKQEKIKAYKCMVTHLSGHLVSNWVNRALVNSNFQLDARSLTLKLN